MKRAARASSGHENAAGWLWISPWVVGFLAFLAAPMAMSLYYSFTDYNLLEKELWVGLDNYGALLRDDVFLMAMRQTAVYACLVVPLSTVVALGIAGLLNARVRARGFFQAAVFVPTLVPMAASAMIWLWLFNADRGLVNTLLRPIWPAISAVATPLARFFAGPEQADAVARRWSTPPNWLIDSGWAMPTLVMISLWGVGQAVVVYVAAMRDVPEQYYEAAAMDGMGPIRRFVSITLPMISPVILFNVITLLIGTVQVFVIPYVLIKATPGGDPRSMYFQAMAMYDNAFVYAKMGYANAQAWVQLVLVLAMTGALFWFSKRFVHYRGG
jgi:multiple sugar transport system permease protein